LLERPGRADECTHGVRWWFEHRHLAPGSNAPGTLTLSLDGGISQKTPTGDCAGDVVKCGRKTLRAPWWGRGINRQAKP
jgi:hypothetical protein